MVRASSASSNMRSEWLPAHCCSLLLCKLRDDVRTFRKYEPPLPSVETLTRKNTAWWKRGNIFCAFQGTNINVCTNFIWNEFHLLHWMNSIDIQIFVRTMLINLIWSMTNFWSIWDSCTQIHQEFITLCYRAARVTALGVKMAIKNVLPLKGLL